MTKNVDLNFFVIFNFTISVNDFFRGLVGEGGGVS